jgi:hypothetical protein
MGDKGARGDGGSPDSIIEAVDKFYDLDGLRFCAGEGDGLAEFIAGEIGSVNDPSKDRSWNIDEAIRAMESAKRQIDNVISGLIAAKGG